MAQLSVNLGEILMKTSKKEVTEKDLEDYSKKNEIKIKVNWVRVLTLGFLTSLAFLFINIIVVLIGVLGFDKDLELFLILMQWVFFGEVGLIVFWGGCLGNIGQSVLIGSMKERILGSKPFDAYSFKHATFNSFSYYFAGGFLLLYLMIMVQILKIIRSYN